MSAALEVLWFEPAAPAADCADISVLLPGDFTLQSGEKLSRPEMRLRLFGPDDAPAVAVAGGISAGRGVADGPGAAGWWREIVGPGRAVDTTTTRVVGFDFLPHPGEQARTITTTDQARTLGLALGAVGVPRLKAFVGASYGGMLALAFAEAFPDRVERLCVLSAADRPHAASTALRGVQRRIVDFAIRAGDPRAGLSLARQLAMTTYRTPEEFDARFAHRPGAAAGDAYPVCEYLIARGDAWDMTPERFVTLSDSIDRHAVDPARLAAKSLFIAVREDRLVPAAQTRRLAEAAPDARYAEISSVYGHDAFLKEHALIAPLIQSFLEER